MSSRNARYFTWCNAVRPSTFWWFISAPLARRFFTSSTSPLDTAERNTVPSENWILVFFLDVSEDSRAVSLFVHRFRDSCRFCKALLALELWPPVNGSAIFPWRYRATSPRTEHEDTWPDRSWDVSQWRPLGIVNSVTKQPWRHLRTRKITFQTSTFRTEHERIETITVFHLSHVNLAQFQPCFLHEFR